MSESRIAPVNMSVPSVERDQENLKLANEIVEDVALNSSIHQTLMWDLLTNQRAEERARREARDTRAADEKERMDDWMQERNAAIQSSSSSGDTAILEKQIDEIKKKLEAWEDYQKSYQEAVSKLVEGTEKIRVREAKVLNDLEAKCEKKEIKIQGIDPKGMPISVSIKTVKTNLQKHDEENPLQKTLLQIKGIVLELLGEKIEKDKDGNPILDPKVLEQMVRHRSLMKEINMIGDLGATTPTQKLGLIKVNRGLHKLFFDLSEKNVEADAADLAKLLPSLIVLADKHKQLGGMTPEDAAQLKDLLKEANEKLHPRRSGPALQA